MNSKLRQPRVVRAIALLGVVFATALPLRGYAGDPLRPLVRILKSASDYKQRLVAVIGLGRRMDKRAAPALIEALKDSHHTVRGAAARVLGKLGDQRARVPLEGLLLRSKNDFVRGQVQEALALLMAAGKSRGERMEVHGTLGTLDQNAIQDGIQTPIQQATNCLGQRLAGAPYLGGKISLKFRITRTGTVKWVRVEQSDLGSFELEQCIVGRMLSARFDAPDGGEAEFTIPLAFSGGDSVTMLDPVRSAPARRLRRSCRKLLRGRLKLPPGVVVTLYIRPNGKVASAGMAAGGAEIPAGLAQSFLSNLKKLRLAAPAIGGSYGKLVHSINCGR